MSALSNNPFKQLLGDLGTNSRLVTIEYLEELHTLFKRYGVTFSTYGSIFEMLQFLEHSGCITITPLDNKSYIITGLYTYGR